METTDKKAEALELLLRNLHPFLQGLAQLHEWNIALSIPSTSRKRGKKNLKVNILEMRDIRMEDDGYYIESLDGKSIGPFSFEICELLKEMAPKIFLYQGTLLQSIFVERLAEEDPEIKKIVDELKDIERQKDTLVRMRAYSQASDLKEKELKLTPPINNLF